MRARRASQEQAAEAARRRLEQLSVELDRLRAVRDPDGAPADPADPAGRADLGDAGAGAADGAARLLPPTMPGRHARRPLPAGHRVGGWLQDRLPGPLQGMATLTPAHLLLVALLVAVGLGLTGWSVLRSGAAGEPVPDRAAPTGGGPDLVPLTPAGAAPGTQPAQSLAPGLPVPAHGAAGAAATGPAEAGTAPVVVDVAGRVRRPGIVTLPAGSRVVDALDAAGGARPRVDLATVNLARPLVDGEQILVGVRPVGGVAAPAADAPAPAGTASPTVPMVNVNTATPLELEALPGVGPVTANAIVQWRTEHGSFASVDQLLDVSGIGEATLAEIAPYVTL